MPVMQALQTWSGRPSHTSNSYSLISTHSTSMMALSGRDLRDGPHGSKLDKPFPILLVITCSSMAKTLTKSFPAGGGQIDVLAANILSNKEAKATWLLLGDLQWQQTMRNAILESRHNYQSLQKKDRKVVSLLSRMTLRLYSRYFELAEKK